MKKFVLVVQLLCVLSIYTLYAQNTQQNDFYNLQWGLHNTGQTGGKSDIDIDAPEAWDYQTDCEAVPIAIIDQGFDLRHEEINERIWQNLGEDSNNNGTVLQYNQQTNTWEYDEADIDGIDNDGNGYVDDFIGWNFDSNSNNLTIKNGHGNFCAGIIGAEANNEKGIKGVCHTSKMAFLQINGDDAPLLEQAAEALNYAVANGFKVSNNSYGTNHYKEAMRVALNAAENAGHLFITTSGNYGNDIDNNHFFPASYVNNNIITVGSINHFGELSNFSNYGSAACDIAAPGTNILSINGADEYEYRDGTSFAAPIIAAAAAMLWTTYPDKTYLEIKEAILNSVDENENIKDLFQANGHFNLKKAIHYFNDKACKDIDSLLLLNIYNHTNGSSWINTWNLNQPMSEWHGITLNENGCVEKIELVQNNLIGKIPNDIGDFGELEYLRLSHNPGLTGEIPSSICNLTNLSKLHLSNNSLTGSIPENIGNLVKLRQLLLQSNNLTGSLPVSLWQLDVLDYFLIYYNNLTGCFPIEISKMCKTETFKQYYINPGNDFYSDWDDFCFIGEGTCTGSFDCEYFIEDDFEVPLTNWECIAPECQRIEAEELFINSGNWCLRVGDDNSNSEIVSKTFSFNQAEFLEFSFSFMTDKFFIGEEFFIEVSNDNGLNWEQLASYSRNINGITNRKRYNEVIDIPVPESGSIKLKIRTKTAINSRVVYIDDVILKSCISDYIGNGQRLTVNNSDITLYPNPVRRSELLNIDADGLENIKSIQIFDLQGRVVHSQNLKEGNPLNNISVASLISGSYLLSIKTNETSLIKKFIVLD